MANAVAYHLSVGCNHCEQPICVEVCPTRAIGPLPVADKKTAKIGEVRFIEDNCIVVTERTACGACAEHCPTQYKKHSRSRPL